MAVPLEPLPQADESSDYHPQWSPWARQFVIIALVIAGVFALTLLIPVLQILVITFLLVFLLYIPSRFIARRTRLNFAGAVVFVYVLLLLLGILLLVTFVPGFVTGVNNVVKDLQQTYDNLRKTLLDYTPEQGFIEVLETRIDLDPIIQPVRELIVGSGALPTGGSGAPFDLGQIVSIATSTFTGVVGSITSVFSTAFLALFLSFLILLDLPNYQDHMLRAVPPAHQREVLLLISKIMQVWNGFFRGQLTLGIIIGVITWLQLTLMGVSQPVTLAITTAIISLIPTIGGIIALIPLGLVPLLQGSTVFVEMPHFTFALLVVGVNLVISQIVWNGVAPKIMGDAVSLPVPMIIIGIFIGTAIGGVLGAFLVVPIIGTLRVIVFYLIKKINQRDPFPGEIAPEIIDLTTI